MPVKVAAGFSMGADIYLFPPFFLLSLPGKGPRRFLLYQGSGTKERLSLFPEWRGNIFIFDLVPLSSSRMFALHPQTAASLEDDDE